MSQYLNIYLKHGDNYIDVADYGRGSEMYKAMSEMVPYGKCCVITEKIFAEADAELNRQVVNYRHLINREEKHIETIQKMEHTDFTERLDYLETCEDSICEYKENIEYCLYAIGQLSILREIDFNNKGCIYMGVEACPPDSSDSARSDG